MSFRWFIYYCAVCGGCAALVGWMLGKLPPFSPGVLLDALKAMYVGLMLGIVLSLIDSLMNFAWSRLFLVAARVLTAGVVGSVAGLLGGLITGGVTRNLNIVPLQIAGQILGWTLTGLLIGAAVGVFDLLVALLRKHDVGGALRKVVHGLAGGAVGGLLGSLLYLLLYGALGALFGNQVDLDTMWTPSAAGFTALGLCIGLLIGAAQVILKEAWAQGRGGVSAGPRANCVEGRNRHRPSRVVRRWSVRRQRHRTHARPHPTERRPLSAGGRRHAGRHLSQRFANLGADAPAFRR